ncbi:neural cell adhesion molecule L1-like isoform X3 [Apostichopus japonicus]|uniref:neural cell adhesion molecule L1-like isoform X3 n=1 Tax=Stichopus japonicus TaxID=307972 RepID=UPI003AB5B580
MKTELSTGVLLLLSCVLLSHASGDDTPSQDKDESPPSKIDVERQGFPYDYGDFGVVMDMRSSMELRCTAVGNPAPTYRWEFDGTALPDDPRISVVDGVLTIQTPQISDEGDYQCFATNKHGTALSSKYQAIYAYQDNYEEVGTLRQEVTEGEEGAIECGAPDGAPKPRIYWSNAQTNKEVALDDRISMSKDGDLHFANVVADDETGYYCFAANDLLGNYMRSPLHVLRVSDGTGDNIAATIVELPTKAKGLREQPFKIKCVAAGFPTPIISWYRDGVLIVGDSDIQLEDHNHVLSFKSLSFGDAGEYVCSADNGESSPATQTVHLTVDSAPYFAAKPKDVILAPAQSGEIQCSEGGVPTPTKKWLQNGQEIRQNENSIYEVSADGNSISITDPREGDSTVFQCVLENEHGQRVGSYTITILAIPAKISKSPAATAVVSEEDDLNLQCEAFGSPTPIIEWRKMGAKLVDDGSRILVTSEELVDANKDYRGTRSNLTVTNLSYEDGGTFECHAMNNMGNDSAGSVISVRLPTTVSMEPDTLDVVKGSAADFTCNVIKDDRATVTIDWFFDDSKINPGQPGSEYSLQGENTLRVRSAKASHSGTFKCTAKTWYDEDSGTAELIVQAEPDAPDNLVLDIAGLEATLSWDEPRSNNAEIMTYEIHHRTQYDTFPTHSDMAPWQLIRTVSAASTTETFTLRNYLTYSFRVTATNSIGTSARSEEKQGEMTPPAPPDEDSTPGNITSKGTSPGVLTVSWDTVHPYYHNGPDFEYVVRYRTEGETEWKEAVISDWRTSSFDISAGEYENIEYSVSVRNQEDDGPAPVQQGGTTGEGRPSAFPSNVQLVAISSNEINVTWDAVPEEDVNGAVKSYNELHQFPFPIKIYYTMSNAQGSEEVMKCSPDETSCVLGDLQAFTTYEIAVALENGFAEGPRSQAQTVTTEEGVPSEVKIEKVVSTSYRLEVTWDKPALVNGIHIGYHLAIAAYDDDDTISVWHNETFENPDILSSRMEDVEPDTKYEVFITAYTRVGDSAPAKRDTTTAAAGKPQMPGQPTLNLAGKEFLNITWGKIADDVAKPDEVRACYKPEGDDDECQLTPFVDVLDDDHIFVKDLDESTKYVVFLEFKNKEGIAKGGTDKFETTGAGLVTGGAALAPWLIAIICIIILLLLIILIVCILKSQKGGKYNVSDKEKQLKDENAPLKNNDGFAEFNQDSSEFPDDVDGSQDSLNSHPEGSEGDSLKEYADDEDPSKFNEEGSFIEEYHDPKTRSTDQREGGTSTFV